MNPIGDRIVTSVAVVASGPLLVAVIVKVPLAPTAAVEGVTEALRATSQDELGGYPQEFPVSVAVNRKSVISVATSMV